MASESASWVTRRSGPLIPLKRRPISRPTQTLALERISATIPAARLVIQNRCGPVVVRSVEALERLIETSKLSIL